MGEQTAKAPGLNRAKTYQLVLFPLNNGATNVYYVLVLSYIATFGSKVLALSMIFASVMVTGMRLFDAITDPIIGALMDRTNGKFGKFRPFMVIGNLIMAASILVLYCLTPLIPASSMFLRYAAFVALYAVWVIGYTFQTSCTRSGQTVLTNDPKQRPLFTIFNTVGSLLGMGAMQFFAPILAKNYEGGYASAGFFRTLAPVGIVISILLTILAIIGIWEKDQPKYFGIGGEVSEKVKLHEYVQIIKNNNPMQRLMVAGAGCKLALSIATNTTVLCMLYGCMMGNYDGLYLPMMVLGYVFSVPFFLLTVRTSQKEGQKLDPGYWESENGKEALQGINEMLAANPRCIIETNDEGGNQPTADYAAARGLDLEGMRVGIASSIGHMLGKLFTSPALGTLLLTGGDTLLQCMNCVGIKELEPVCEVEKGVVLARFTYRGCTRYVITKSGGFGHEKLLLDLADRIAAEQT